MPLLSCCTWVVTVGQDIELGLNDGVLSLKGRAVWKNPKDWGPWLKFVLARYAIMFVGFLMVLAALWFDHSPTSGMSPTPHRTTAATQPLLRH